MEPEERAKILHCDLERYLGGHDNQDTTYLEIMADHLRQARDAALEASALRVRLRMDGTGVTAGELGEDILSMRTGAKIASDANPWCRETRNLSAQGRILREDRALAARLKAQAGL